jgi:hypothetical protein
LSTIRVDNFGPSAGGTTYSARGIAKAWVNFNGTGTIAARDSENVSSLTDNGTGDYTLIFGKLLRKHYALLFSNFVKRSSKLKWELVGPSSAGGFAPTVLLGKINGLQVGKQSD